MTKKKKSSLQIMRERYKRAKSNFEYFDKRNDELLDLNLNLTMELKELYKIIPLKFYKISYRIKNNSGEMQDNAEIYEAPSPQMAIKKLKLTKTHPDTFELKNIEVLA